MAIAKACSLSINNSNIIKSKIKHALWRFWFNHKGKIILFEKSSFGIVSVLISSIFSFYYFSATKKSKIKSKNEFFKSALAIF